MHELSIAQEIAGIVHQYVNPVDRLRVRAVMVNVGVNSNIVSDSLVFCYEAIKDEYDLKNSFLDIKNIPLTASCHTCLWDGEISGVMYLCPNCGSGEIKVKSGEELRVSEIELDDKE